MLSRFVPPLFLCGESRACLMTFSRVLTVLCNRVFRSMVSVQSRSVYRRYRAIAFLKSRFVYYLDGVENLDPWGAVISFVYPRSCGWCLENLKHD